jgi:hypothetical protein
MDSYVVDTNVLVVANGKYQKANFKHIYIYMSTISYRS